MKRRVVILACTIAIISLHIDSSGDDKRPIPESPSVETAITPEKIKDKLVKEYLSRDYKVADESTYQIAFWREIKEDERKGYYAKKHDNLHNYLKHNRFSETPKELLTFKMIPSDSKVKIIADMEVTVKLYSGQVDRWSLTPDKERREEMARFLSSL